jgi:hypothetical protein
MGVEGKVTAVRRLTIPEFQPLVITILEDVQHGLTGVVGICKLFA